MIVTRTPFRISFFGGGTDYPIWYRENKGAVLASTIDKYCYITCRYLPPFFEHSSRIVYSKIETVTSISNIQHVSVRKCLEYLSIDQGVEIHHDADLPARTGIGSSSSFTVGLLPSLHSLQGRMTSKRKLCFDAIHVEQNMIRENVGSQDQTLASFGGLNLIKFSPLNNIHVHPFTISTERTNLLHSHLMLLFTGFSRIASDVAHEQIRNIPEKRRVLKMMYEMVEEGSNILNSQCDIVEFGKLLHESWKMKSSLSLLITTPCINEIYDVALQNGAIGGKLLGAGGGGFLLLFSKPHDQPRIREKLKTFLSVPFNFENLGSQVTLYSPQEIEP